MIYNSTAGVINVFFGSKHFKLGPILIFRTKYTTFLLEML
jgi:hypothetical protein